jgi:hypothetical protein
MQEKAIHIRERYNAFREKKDASITEIHDFVKKMPKLTKEFKSLNQHINIAAMLKHKTDTREFRDQWQGERGMLEGEGFLDEIEDRLYADAVVRSQLALILRLLCIQSITAGGIRANRYDSIRRAISQIYGFQHLITMSNFERAGLIKRKETLLVDTTVPIWQILRKQLKLIDERTNVSAIPDDISYVSAGYAPLVVRLVQMLIGVQQQSMGLTNGTEWYSPQTLADALKLLPGPMLELTQQAAHAEDLADALQRSASEMAMANAEFAAVMSQSSSSFLPPLGLSSPLSKLGLESSPSEAIDGEGGKKKVMMILVVGGLSFMEIAAFRFLSKDPSFPFRIITATTKIVNGTSLLSSMYHSF